MRVIWYAVRDMLSRFDLISALDETQVMGIILLCLVKCWLILPKTETAGRATVLPWVIPHPCSHLTPRTLGCQQRYCSIDRHFVYWVFRLTFTAALGFGKKVTPCDGASQILIIMDVKCSGCETFNVIKCKYIIHAVNMYFSPTLCEQEA